MFESSGEHLSFLLLVLIVAQLFVAVDAVVAAATSAVVFAFRFAFWFAADWRLGNLLVFLLLPLR